MHVPMYSDTYMHVCMYKFQSGKFGEKRQMSTRLQYLDSHC